MHYKKKIKIVVFSSKVNTNVTFVPVFCDEPLHEEVWGVEACLLGFMILALDGGEWPSSRSGRFTPAESPDTHCIEG